MRSFLAGLRRLVIPWGATADQPRVVIATDDPLARAFADAAVSYYFTGGRGFATWVAPAPGTGGLWGISAGPADADQFAERVDFLRAQYGGDSDPTDDTVTVGAGQRSGRATHFRSWHDIDGGGGLVGVAEIVGDRIDLAGPVTIGGVPAGRGVVARPSFNGGAMVAAGTAETVAVVVPVVTYKQGRAYEIRVTGQMNTAADCDLLLQVRKGIDLTGPVRLARGRIRVNGTVDRPLDWSGVLTIGKTTGDVTTELALTAAASAGTVNLRGFSTGPFAVSVTDVGTSDQFPGSSVLS